MEAALPADAIAGVPGERTPPRSLPLDQRKAAILRAVVEEYIETASPVGSAHVAGRRGLGVSAATVRNDMARLEADGYLAHPHTSAGRIPTDKGYRFFVDQCPARSESLGPPEQRLVAEFFARASGQISRMLADTTRLLADLTHYAALVVAPSHHDATVRSVQLVRLGPRLALAVAVLSDGTVDKSTVEMSDAEITDAQVVLASGRLAAALVGRSLSGGENLGSSGRASVDGLVAQAHQALLDTHRVEAEQVFVGGTAKMAATFDAVDTVRQVLSILEEQYLVVRLIGEALGAEGLTVSIGAEHGVESLAECSIVAAPYEVDGVRVGTIGILGPTRMHYPQAMAAVDAVSRRLGHHLRDR
ncbi:MAG: heat-inducible transcriptional repressor HrcA [Acidimicrobiales bacterium]